jgi:fluoride ion exporter CrcB/FEX
VLVERKTYALAGAYALGSVIPSLFAIFVGMALARAIV